MNYINIGDDSLNLQRITDNWTKNQPILMVVNTNLNHQSAEEQIGKGTLFSMLPIHGLSFLPNDSPYRINNETPEIMEKFFFNEACKVEIEKKIYSIYPYGNTVYMPSIFFNWDSSDLNIRERLLEDLFLVNQRYHKKETICFFDDFNIKDDQQLSELISSELKEFFDRKKDGILKTIVSGVF